MPKDRIRCKNCRAALLKHPDIPERVELWAYHEAWDKEEDPNDWPYYPHQYPAPATYLQATTGQAWREYMPPIWTCQWCKHENDAEHVGEEAVSLLGLDELEDWDC